MAQDSPFQGADLHEHLKKALLELAGPRLIQKKRNRPLGELSEMAKARGALFRRRAARRGATDPGGDGILSRRIRLILACHNLPRFHR
jgi:hypothetical protein